MNIKEQDESFATLLELLKDEVKPPSIYPISTDVAFQFCGWAIVINRNGTWYWEDTSGG